MPGQEQQRPSRRDKDEVEHEVEPLPRSGAQTEDSTATDDVDALLDEIDDVLESNAEQFVRQYTQKGGQ
ncbi:ubiquitin-like protein Pup [Streptomyces sp. NP160]|uniref:ubiquitin-like protein Pup n=1 Tax=Streptomyces sp. NP160 TaxID=2586637 RepID=UPI0015D5A2E2|nr:ubiquitin-like protein Pup [Streptomyces sp. NP160]